MEKRILLEKRGRVANQIKELNLDNCRSNFIDGLTDEFTALEKLSLINVSLTTLKNFPKLPSLKKLELSDNRISNALSNLLTSPKLISLNLSGNKIKDFDELKPLASLEKLEILDLFNNEVTMAENYRGNVFKLLPSLKYLDGFDPAENEAPSDEDDEVNGVDSDDDDDDEDAFCVNGIDIDLKELDILEQRIKAKKAASSVANASRDGECSNDQIVDELNECIEKKLKLTNDENELKLQQQSQPASMASIFLVIMSFFSILNQIYYRPSAKNDYDHSVDDDLNNGEDDGEDDGEDEDLVTDGESEENAAADDFEGFGLADVYNDDLEELEDNSDYDEEREEDEDVDEDSDDDADETAEKIEGAEGEAEAESPARGKKRKHDGEGEGEGEA